MRHNIFSTHKSMLMLSLIGGLAITMLTSCSDDTYSPDPDKGWQASTNVFSPVDEDGFTTYYNPSIGRCGDPMPFYDAKNGVFRVMYLQEYDQNTESYHPFWCISTKDAAHYTSMGEVLPAGAPQEQDAGVGTGCCVYDEQTNTYYIYYTGHNAACPQTEAVMRATSKGGRHFVKDRLWMLKGADYGFDKTDFRDPQIFRGDDNLWHMVISTKLKFAEFTSDNLTDWTAAGSFNMVWDRMCECPDIFKMGNYWYLVYSEAFKTSWSRKVKYMMADSWENLKRCFDDPGANWPKDGREGVLDTRAFYAAKSASNGKERYIWGWCPTRDGADLWAKNINVGAGDGNEPKWSGSLVCHRLIQHADGTLTCGEVPAFAAKYNQPARVNVMAKNGAKVSGKQVELEGNDAYVLYNRLGYHNHISFTVTTSNNWDKFGVSFVRGTDSKKYYTMVFNPEDENHRKINFEEEGPEGKGFVEAVDGYWFERPSENTYKVDIYTDNSVMVMYVNDNVCYTNRIYGIQKNCWSINNYGGKVTVSDVTVSQY